MRCVSTRTPPQAFTRTCDDGISQDLVVYRRRRFVRCPPDRAFLRGCPNPFALSPPNDEIQIRPLLFTSRNVAHVAPDNFRKRSDFWKFLGGDNRALQARWIIKLVEDTPRSIFLLQNRNIRNSWRWIGVAESKAVPIILWLTVCDKDDAYIARPSFFPRHFLK